MPAVNICNWNFNVARLDQWHCNEVFKKRNTLLSLVETSNIKIFVTNSQGGLVKIIIDTGRVCRPILLALRFFPKKNIFGFFSLRLVYDFSSIKQLVSLATCASIESLHATY